MDVFSFRFIPTTATWKIFVAIETFDDRRNPLRQIRRIYRTGYVKAKNIGRRHELEGAIGTATATAVDARDHDGLGGRVCRGITAPGEKNFRLNTSGGWIMTAPKTHQALGPVVAR